MAESGGVHARVYPPVGYCIYCGVAEGELSREHIIPYALSGTFILPQASCAACAKVTQKFEEVCAHDTWGMFASLRRLGNLKSRGGLRRRKEIKRKVMYQDGTLGWETLPVGSLPVVAPILKMPIATILQGLPPASETEIEIGLRLIKSSSVLTDNQLRGVLTAQVRVGPFMQLIAKIGYAYAAAELGAKTLYPMLADFILGKGGNGPHLIGGFTDPPESLKAPYLHRMSLHELARNNAVYTLVQVHLFGELGLPKYHVVVREGPAD